MNDTLTETEAQALIDEVDAAVAHWIARARDILDLTSQTLPLPTVRFDLRGRMAGQAVLARRKTDGDAIRINSDLLLTHTRQMIDVTVPHEVAHVAIHRCCGRDVRPHGREWKALMGVFGVPAVACHDLPTTPARRLRRFPYRCGCAEPVWLTSIRHKRALGGTVYRCRRCGLRLEFDSGTH